MSIDAMHWVWEESKSKGVGRHILLAIADTARTNIDDCQAYASVRFLANRANCSNGAVAEALTLLVESKELEIVRDAAGKPVKGRHGATCYRLPLAVGFVRAAIRMRSAQRNDFPSSDAPDRPAEPNDSKEASEANRSAQRNDPVFGSAERFGAGSFGSAEHTTTSSPEEPPPPTAPPSSSAPDGGGGSSAEQNTNRAQLLLQKLPAPWTLGPADARKLAPQLATAAAQLGWEIGDQLAAAICTNPGGMNNPAEILAKKRIPNLLPYTAVHGSRSSLPPACPACLAENPHARHNPRWRTRHGRPCPDCHPDTAASAAA